MLFYQWNYHEAVHALLPGSFSDEIGANVESRVDTILVMGKDNETCRSWTAKAISSICEGASNGNDPDFARSFLKVDAAFLRSLPQVWWE